MFKSFKDFTSQISDILVIFYLHVWERLELSEFS